MHPRMVCAFLVVALSSAACHTLKPVTMHELDALKPDRAWVTEQDHSVMLVDGPQVMGDTLVGYVAGVYEEMLGSRFTQVLVQKPATSRTVLLVGALAVGFGGMVYALTGSGAGGQGQSDLCDKHPDYPECIF